MQLYFPSLFWRIAGPDLHDFHPLPLIEDFHIEILNRNHQFSLDRRYGGWIQRIVYYEYILYVQEVVTKILNRTILSNRIHVT